MEILTPLFFSLYFLFISAVLVGCLRAVSRWLPKVLSPGKTFPRGVEVEAEIVARFEAGAPYGSDLAKARHPMMASWDLLELELRYFFNGREIVSRRSVAIDTFFRTRSVKTLRIVVPPGKPEWWTALP